MKPQIKPIKAKRAWGVREKGHKTFWRYFSTEKEAIAEAEWEYGGYDIDYEIIPVLITPIKK
jgi:hypothetical protein